MGTCHWSLLYQTIRDCYSWPALETHIFSKRTGRPPLVVDTTHVWFLTVKMGINKQWVCNLLPVSLSLWLFFSYPIIYVHKNVTMFVFGTYHNLKACISCINQYLYIMNNQRNNMLLQATHICWFWWTKEKIWSW